MRRILVAVLLVALIATAVLAVNAIGAAGSSTSHTLKPWAQNLANHPTPATPTDSRADGRSQRIVLRDVTAREKAVDADDNGRESVGDYVVFTDRLSTR